MVGGLGQSLKSTVVSDRGCNRGCSPTVRESVRLFADYTARAFERQPNAHKLRRSRMFIGTPITNKSKLRRSATILCTHCAPPEL